MYNTQAYSAASATSPLALQHVPGARERFVLRVPSNLDPAGAVPLFCAGITTCSPKAHRGDPQ